MPFGEPVAQFWGNTLYLKVTARVVDDLVTPLYEITRQLVVIDILHVFTRPQHLEILQGFPTAFDGVARGVEHDAVAVQMRIKRPRRVVPEDGTNNVPGGAVGHSFSRMNPRSRELLQFPQRRFHATVVGVHNAWIITNQGRNRNRFGW